MERNTASSFAYINGELKPQGLPSWFSHLGVGVFDTLRVRLIKPPRAKQPEVRLFGFNAHLERLFAGAKAIGAKSRSATEIEEAAHTACISFDWSHHDNARLRIVVLEKDWIVTIEPWVQHLDTDKGISTITFLAERTFPEIKSCSAIGSYMARREAEKRGVGEAFL